MGCLWGDNISLVITTYLEFSSEISGYCNAKGFISKNYITTAKWTSYIEVVMSFNCYMLIIGLGGKAICWDRLSFITIYSS